MVFVVTGASKNSALMLRSDTMYPYGQKARGRSARGTKNLLPKALPKALLRAPNDRGRAQADHEPSADNESALELLTRADDEQDAVLDDMSSAVARLNAMGQDINQELNEQRE